MITTVLYILLALAFLTIAASLTTWVTHRDHGHLGKHTQQALEAWLDMQYARRLRRMNARPVYTPPQTYQVVPDCMQPGSYSSVQEVHHGRRGELHKDVLAATLHNPWLPGDIRAEQAKNLPQPVPGATGDNHRLGELNLGQDVRQPETGLLAEPTNTSMGNWQRRELAPASTSTDTAVDMSLHAAIRADVDGDYTGQITDRYFSVISLPRIFADLGITYVRTAVTL